MIEDVVELIRDCGGEPCVLVGHDWGGAAAWYTAMTHPELVRKLVVLNSPHPKPLLREIKRSLNQRIRMMYQLFLQVPSAAPLIRPLLPLILRGRFTAEEREEYRKAWRKPDAVRSMSTDRSVSSVMSPTLPQRSRTTAPAGRAEQISTLPSAGNSTGSGS